MSLALFHTHPLYAWAMAYVAAFGALSFPALLLISAPYGRHHRPGWGPAIHARLGWVLMEAPSPLGFALVFLRFWNGASVVPVLLAFLWQAHYVYRAFVYPFRMRGAGKTKPLLTTVLAVAFNCCNGPMNAFAITALAPHLTNAWLRDPRFLAGVALYALGSFWNHQSDAILRGLRKPGETGYRVPHGGLYRFISAPNYFGEVVEWLGFALAAFTPAAAIFAAFTAANLLPRGVSHHRWYRERFPDYPKERRAVIPFVW
jgi:3-oxo-5-alpha-steroid 4-dehydrogenase 1